jgi:hypothetical protein
MTLHTVHFIGSMKKLKNLSIKRNPFNIYLR